MTLRMYEYKCDVCGAVRESLEDVGTEAINAPCQKEGSTQSVGCKYQHIVSVPKSVKIDTEANAYVPRHVRRARALGHDGGTSATEGQYDNEPREGYQKKIQVGPR